MKRIALALTCAALLPSCATIIRGTSESFTVDSIPQGADVRFSTGQQGTTPFTLKVRRSETLSLTVSKPGYETQQVSIPPQISSGGAIATGANLLAFRDLGGLISAAVDASDGAATEHKPNPFVVRLERW